MKMPAKKRQDLYDLFATGNKPTHDDFVDLIDSMINIAEDGIGISEKGRPMEIIEQGTSRRFLDLSSSKDTPIWRISAQSTDGQRSGLNVSSAANKSRIFVRQDNGYTGINNDSPIAKLHITPDIGPALRVDDENKEISLIIGANGKVGIGAELQDAYRLFVDGHVYLKGDTFIDGPVSAKKGVIVDGAKLIAERGLSVKNGVTVESGFLKVEEEFTVNGPVSAYAGAVIEGLPLEANKGLLVKEGATVETGVLTANGGLVVNGGIEANAGVIVDGAPLTAKNGLAVTGGATIINGELLANNGLTVNNSAFEANDRVILGNTDTGTVRVKGEFTAEKGVIVENAPLIAEQGAIIRGDDIKVTHNLIVEGEIRTNGKLTVNNSALEASGKVFLGNESTGDVTVNGEILANKGINIREGVLQAQAGAIVTGAELQVDSGLIVNNGAIIETGLFTANEGVFVPEGSPLDANGVVTLGNQNDGPVTVNGQLRAVNGGIVSGSELEIQNGLRVNSTFNALYDSYLQTANIQRLNVHEINVTGGLGLESVNLRLLKVYDTEVTNMAAGGEVSLYGKCQVNSNTVLAGGKIYATYEGEQEVSPKIIIKEGPVTGGKGHFDFDIDDDKVLTITYDGSSDINNFINNWKDYKKANIDKAGGYNFQRVGTGAWKPKNEEVELVSSGVPFKEYKIRNNGVRILYTGTEPGEPQFIITRNDKDMYTDKFNFAIHDLLLVIYYPNKLESRTVRNLLTDWLNWKNNNPELAADFSIQQVGDGDWRLDDILDAQELIATENVVREYKQDGLIIKNSSSLQNQPKVIIAGAAPGFRDNVEFAASFDTLTITLGVVDNTPQAVYNAWEEWVKSGSETYGFEIVETADSTPIRLRQEAGLVSIDGMHSEIEVAGIAVRYTGEDAGMARVILEEGSVDKFSFIIDDQNKELTINYPANVEKRTVANLLVAWEGVAERHGFEIFGRSQAFSVRQTKNLETIVAEIKEYTAVTRGVDNLTVRYTGPGDDKPAVIIRANDTNEFAVSINEDNVIIIEYPPDKSGSIDELLAYWDGFTPEERGGFSLIKHDIENVLVDESGGNLEVNEENKIFSQGLIRTNTVTIDGCLAFGNSGVEISGISDNEGLSEASDALLPTQKAVKTYVDTGLEPKADLEYVNKELEKKANLEYVNEELDKKAALEYVNEELDKKADLSYVDEELEKKANLDYVEEELDKKADLEYVNEELDKKTNLAKLENLSVGQGATVSLVELGLTSDCSGFLLVMVTAAGYSGAGLFAVNGTGNLFKIAGDRLSEWPDNPDTCNLYFQEGDLMLQNATEEEVGVKAIYFGT